MRISVLAFFLFFFCGLIVFSACDEKHETEPSYPVDGDTCDRTVLVYMLGAIHWAVLSKVISLP